MILPAPDDFEWPEPWEPIISEDVCLEFPRITARVLGEEPPESSLVRELQWEVAPGHPLYRVACGAVARNRKDPNEFLFLTANDRMPLAFVHLTWGKEKGPDFPWVEGYESWDAFRVAWLDSRTEYTLRFFFEWGGGCLWPGNDDAYSDLGLGPYDVFDPCPLPLSAATLEQCRRMAEWHDTSLNWDYPPNPGPWRQPECDQFNEATRLLLATIRAELGDRFDVVNQQPEAVEDIDLDAYLADPKGFRRRTT